jgi:hypothetical protein
MMDFLKILIEEPGKLRKFGIFLSKGILNLIFATKLYLWCVGPFNLLDIGKYQSWFDFVVSGRVLICALLFVVSDIILFNILPIVLFAPLDWICKRRLNVRMARKERDKINKVLAYFELFTIDEKTKKIKAAKHTDAFYDFLLAAAEKESKEDANSIKSAFVTEALNTYGAFIFIYFLFLYDDFHSKVLVGIIVAGCVLLPLAYVAIRIILDFIINNAEKMAFGIRGLRFEKLIMDTLKNIGTYPLVVDDPVKLGYENYIVHNGKTFILKFYYSNSLINEYLLNYFKDIFIKEEKKMILIVNNDLTRNAKDLVEEYRNSLVVITFVDENDLTTKLEDHFKKN